MSVFAGVFAYRGNSTVAIVPKNATLIAVLDESLYPLKWIKGDEFKNGAGEPVIFRRAANGDIEGLVEKTDYFPRISAAVPPEIISLTVSRPPTKTAYAYQAPSHSGDGVKVGPAAEVGFNETELQSLVQAIIAERYANVDGVLLWRKGRLVLEEYFYGYDGERPHQLRSATKSFISTLVGIAVDQGKIRGADQPIVELLPWPVDSIKNPDPRKARITVGDLLSMRSGLDCDDRNSASLGNDSIVYQQPDWARYTIDLPMIADPGTVARYGSAGPYLASRLVEHATGQKLFAFAQATLFEPLGFKNHRWPHQTVRGNENTFAQLYLRPRDMMKFGILYLQGGQWEGRQLVSREWIERSTQPLTQIGSKAYGYFWWHQTFTVKGANGKRSIDALLATGNGGQKIFIVPSLELVAVFTGGNYNSPADTPPNEIMGNLILPQLSGE